MNETTDRGWDRIGFEVELLSPVGVNRLTLAEDLASRYGGTVRPFFHYSTALQTMKDRPTFHYLTLGFEVVNKDGVVLCRLVDDSTIQSDLNQEARPAPNWYQVLSDEPRLLRLVQRLVDPLANAEKLLDPVAKIFGAEIDYLPGGIFRVDDTTGSTIAMVVPQQGERERVCELITPPLASDHETQLEKFLGPARALGFSIPSEAAVHAHLDAEPFRSAKALAKLVEVFSADREELWQTLGTNKKCRRLGPLPDELYAKTRQNGFQNLSWDKVVEVLETIPLTKFSDCNLKNLVKRSPLLDTVEIRILPGAITATPILAGIKELCHRFTEKESNKNQNPVQ